MYNLTKSQLKASAKLLHQASIDGGGSAWLILKKILTAVALAEIAQEKEDKWVWISYDDVIERIATLHIRTVDNLLSINHVHDNIPFFGVDGHTIKHGTLQNVITESEKYWSSYFD
jgi:hypothetical protein